MEARDTGALGTPGLDLVFQQASTQVGPESRMLIIIA